LEEIRRFEERAAASGVANQIVLAARYVLCAGLDEDVLATPWGGQSEWAQQTLLVSLHREAFGGEKFFEMLERLAQDPARHLDLMELQYLSLAFGFAGKYQLQDRGHVRLAEVQQEIYRQIRSQRGAPAPELALRWRGLEDRRNPLIRYVPWWMIGAAALAVLALTFVFYWTQLGKLAQPVEDALNDVGSTVARAAGSPAPAGGPTLRQLLKPDEDRRAVRIQEDGRGRTTVTIVAADLFSSGSAQVNPDYNTVLAHIASALDQVPGLVTVVGHTDRHPVRSLRFGNNAQLSRERAATVAAILRSGLRIPARIDSTGRGDTDSLPGVDPYDESNRRVEIIHSGGF
jgi:type VI secretion system protein ImpK